MYSVSRSSNAWRLALVADLRQTLSKTFGWLGSKKHREICGALSEY
jgi:hypothetical protein